MKTKRIFFLLVYAFISIATTAQIQLVKDGKPISRIITVLGDSVDLRAATLLQDFVKRMSGAELSILPSGTVPGKGDILIGKPTLTTEIRHFPELKEDGFFISTETGYIMIMRAEGKGSIYGVVTLLEDYFDVHYYAQNTCTFPSQKNLSLPRNIRRVDNPSFRYRQAQTYSMTDPIYKLWFRLEEPREVFAGNLWVHTFNKILPAAEFGATHPEYFSFIKGMRRPGAASQWCLTNPDVFEIVSHRVDSIFKANPGKNIISLSQNDGNYTNCSCDKCKAIDDKEGGPSGSLIWFLNRVAARFPDKEFSTLAYLYSVAPPKTLKPLPNVNIMLCDIDCRREVPLTDNASGKTFVRDMEGWSKISNNIFVWDYGINFDNYISPFPNFHILQPNMQLFKKNNASMHYSQIGAKKGGDFADLRSYVVAKLLWNTSLNVDSLIQSFLKGFYGDAGPFIYQYLKIQEGALVASNIPLWIYDTPITHKDGMLNHNMMKKYIALFDMAEKAVAGNETFLKRVQEARLTIQYSELEIARTEVDKDVNVLQSKLNIFRDRSKNLGVSVLNERFNTIEEYCTIYPERNFPRPKKSLASGASVSYILPASATYVPIAAKALTDGLFGGATYNESWVGWEGKDGEFVIDLGEVKEIESIEPDFLHKLGAWIFLPKSVSCSISIDNNQYNLIETKQIAEDQSREVKYVLMNFRPANKIKARYIKLKIETIGICPSWHYGVGYPAWFFLDEVSVY